MMIHTLMRPVGLALMMTGIGLSATSVSATGEATLRIESLTTNSVTAASLLDYYGSGNDGGLLAITTSHVLVGYDAGGNVSDGVAFPLDSFNSGVAAEFADESVILVNDLSDQTAYAFAAPDVVPLGLGRQFTWDELAELDALGNVVSRISLSPAIVIESDEVSNETCINVGSGSGVIGVWDLCTGTFWTIDLPSGTVTSYTDGVADFLDYNDENLWPTYDYSETHNEDGQPRVSSGVLEYFDGTWHMALPAENYDGDLASIARFSVFEPSVSPEVILDFEGSNPDLYTFSVSPSAGIWCAYTEVAPEFLYGFFNNEMMGCWDATFTVTTPEALPSTGVSSEVALLVGLGSVAAGAVLTVGRRRRLA